MLYTDLGENWHLVFGEREVFSTSFSHLSLKILSSLKAKYLKSAVHVLKGQTPNYFYVSDALTFTIYL